jgi:pyruvate dehydrogenase (quinone)
MAQQEAQMSQTVADILVHTLEEIGVRHIFGLIGDSLNPLADAVRRSRLKWIGVRHEEGAALAAAGQAKLTGRLGVCCGTTGPGSTHLVAGLYEAARDHAPVLALSGDMPRQLHGTDFIQTTEPDLLFRDVSLYTETLSAPAQAPAIIHQAIAAAYAGRGVAHLTLPQVWRSGSMRSWPRSSTLAASSRKSELKIPQVKSAKLAASLKRPIDCVRPPLALCRAWALPRQSASAHCRGARRMRADPRPRGLLATFRWKQYNALRVQAQGIGGRS